MRWSQTADFVIWTNLLIRIYEYELLVLYNTTDTVSKIESLNTKTQILNIWVSNNYFDNENTHKTLWI